MDFFDGHELGDISDYDDTTLTAANEAFFLCFDSDEYESAEPLLKIAAENGHSYSMTMYALLLLHKRERTAVEIEKASELLLVAAIRGEEQSREYFNTKVEKDVTHKIAGTLRKMCEPSVEQWIRGQPIAAKQDEKRVQRAKTIFQDWLKKSFSQDDRIDIRATSCMQNVY